MRLVHGEKIWLVRWLLGNNTMASVQTTTGSNTTDPIPQPVQHGHSFCKKTFHKPSYCHHCSDMLWGLIQQGFICEGMSRSYPSNPNRLRNHENLLVSCNNFFWYCAETSIWHSSVLSSSLCSDVIDSWIGPLLRSGDFINKWHELLDFRRSKTENSPKI